MKTLLKVTGTVAILAMLVAFAFSFGSLPYPGACPVVTWNQNGTMNPDKKAVLWILMTGDYHTNSAAGLYAVPALPTNGSFGTNPLLSDITNGPGAVKFSEPTVVDGHVYMETSEPAYVLSLRDGAVAP